MQQQAVQIHASGRIRESGAVLWGIVAGLACGCMAFRGV
jgi:hypothetical protein